MASGLEKEWPIVKEVHKEVNK